MKNKFDLIIFDWDGTLINSIDWIVSCIQKAARHCDCRIPEAQEARNVIGLSLENALNQLFPDIGQSARLRLTRSYSENFLAKQAAQEDLFAGVYDMLVQLQQQGYQLAVATGKSRMGLQKAMSGTGTEALFNASRCADETASKPDPTMIQEIIGQLAAANDRTLMVGDSIHDLQMAANANISCVAVSCGAHSSEQLMPYRPLRCLSQTTELLHLLSRGSHD